MAGLFDRHAMKKNAHWLLRLAVASVFIYHGADKLPRIDIVADIFGFSESIMWIVAITEIGAGSLMLLAPLLQNDNFIDKATRLSALALMPIMIVAIAKIHWGQWTFMPTQSHPLGGMEFQVALLALLVFFLIKGRDI